jgi:hypothetical protein
MVATITLGLAVLNAATDICADESNPEQLAWAECSWGVYESHGLTELQEKIAFGKLGKDYFGWDYEEWENFDDSVVKEKCGDTREIFRKDAQGQFEALRRTSPGQ